jgi:flagellum-specific peptidoglycan hydrolase FlgJ
MLSRKEWIAVNVGFAREVTKGTKIFPETLLAMAIVESQYPVNGNYYPGESPLAKKGQNYFGIKKGVGWSGPTITLPTPNDADKTSIFRKYSNFKESCKDFVSFLQKNPRYKENGVFDANDYVEQIVSIAKSGYAESNAYINIVTKVAASVKKQIDKIIAPIVKNNAIIPLMVAALIISLYFIKKTFNA